MSSRRIARWHALLPAVLVGLVLAGRLVAAPATTTALWGPPGPGGHALLVLGGALVVAGLVVRGRWPLTVLLLVTAVMVGWIVAGYPGPGALLPIAIAMHSVWRRRPARAAAGATAAVTLVVIGVTLWLIDRGGEPGQAITSASIVWLGGALGLVARSRAELAVSRQAEARHAAQAQEQVLRRQLAEERLELAQQLHDTVGHRLAVISVQSNVARELLADPDGARRAIDHVREAARAALGEMTAALDGLRDESVPGAGGDGGVLAVRRLVEDMSDPGHPVQLRVDLAGDLDPDLDRLVHRIVREGLTNAHKHAPGAEVEVVVVDDPAGVRVAVVNGPPPHPVPPVAGSGLGLRGIEAGLPAGSALEHGRTSDGGFRLHSVLERAPVAADRAAR